MSAATPAGATNRVVVPGSATGDGFAGSWAQLGEGFAATTVQWPPAAAVLTQDLLSPALAAWAVATDPGRETLVATAGRIDEDRAQQLRSDGLALVRTGPPQQIEPADPPRPALPGRVWLLTSGSTGRPKQAAHTLASLTTVGGDQPERTWLCPYTPGAYAWWQLVTLSLTVPGQHIVFVGADDDWPAIAAEYGVTAASGTPTFWRRAAFRSGQTLGHLEMEQVTLGGEPVDQQVLDQLAGIFPNARISWIYASTEAGAAIAVHDGRAGFPEGWLERDTAGRPRLGVEDDELVIASRASAEGLGETIRTGDRVEVVDGRVLITGRIGSDEINVGGSKASAAQVRSVLLDHPEVVWAAVRGRRAPLVGQVVMAEVVLRPETDRDGTSDSGVVTDRDLTAWCAARLPEHAVPRRLRILPEIPIKETLKSDV